MARKGLTATNSTVVITIGGNDMKDLLDGVRIRHSAPVENDTRFSNEATGGDNSIGTEIATLTFTMAMASGVAGATPFVPLSAFQNVAVVVEFDTDCEWSANVNFFDSELNMPAGVNRRVVGVAQSKGTITISWDEGNA